MVLSRLRKTNAAPLIFGASTTLIACTAVASAQNTGSAKISFSFYGTTPGYLEDASATGNFTIATNSNPNNNLSSLSAFNLFETTYYDGGLSSYTNNYNLGDLDSFSLSFPNGTPTVSLLTKATTTTPPSLLPTSFIVNANIGGTPLGQGTINSGEIELENSSVEAALIANAVDVYTSGPVSLSGQNTTINATFKPNYGVSLADAAAIGGFDDYDWVQMVTYLPSPSAASAISNPTVPLTAPPEFNDPPKGGTIVRVANNQVKIFPCDGFPYYYDPDNGDLFGQELGGTLKFSDLPFDSCLAGGAGLGCDGQTVPNGVLSEIQFTTYLVGINSFDPMLYTPLYEFKWESNFNGLSGGVSEQLNGLSVDPGSGTGGVTLLSEQYLLPTTGAVPEIPTWALMFVGFVFLVSARKLLVAPSDLNQ